MFWMAPVDDAGRIDCRRQFCPPGTAKQAPKCQVCDLQSAITMWGVESKKKKKQTTNTLTKKKERGKKYLK